MGLLPRPALPYNFSLGYHGNEPPLACQPKEPHGWPKAHGPPPLWGEIQSREARWGESGWSTLGVPLVVHPPRSGLPRKLGEYYSPRVLLEEYRFYRFFRFVLLLFIT